MVMGESHDIDDEIILTIPAASVETRTFISPFQNLSKMVFLVKDDCNA